MPEAGPWQKPASAPGSGESIRRTQPGWPRRRQSRSSIRNCPLLIRIITSGTARIIVTCCMNCLRTCAAGTTWSPPCSCNATRCTAPAGPEEMRPVGETEFVAGIAAMSDSGGYGPTRVAAGIVGYADLTLGERVEAVLEAQIRAGGGRFRGVRHSGNWDADPSSATVRRVPTSIAAPISARAWLDCPRLACRWMPGCSSHNWRM